MKSTLGDLDYVIVTRVKPAWASCTTVSVVAPLLKKWANQVSVTCVGDIKKRFDGVFPELLLQIEKVLDAETVFTMAVILGSQLLHRYTLAIAEDNEGGPFVNVTTSFYRGQCDPAYRDMIGHMIDDGLFDDFIAGVLQGLVYQGN